MRHAPLTLAILGAVALGAACDNSSPPTAPTASTVAASSEREDEGCRARADFVVGNEPELIAALAAATSGQVIGVRGNISISADISITTPGLTLTCATDGAGLSAQPGVVWMLNVSADNVAVDRLTLDAIAASAGAYRATGAADLRLTRDSIDCALIQCALFDGNTPRARVIGNHLVGHGSATGVQLQFGIDGSRIEGNTIVQLIRPARLDFFSGGVRIRGGNGLSISRNTVLGPWVNSITLAELANSTIQGNDLEAAILDGIQFPGVVPPGQTLSTGNRIHHNKATGAFTGIFLTHACGNRIGENQLDGNTGNAGLTFSATTGNNTVELDDPVGYLITDQGAFDCDGDGLNDPNAVRYDD